MNGKAENNDCTVGKSDFENFLDSQIDKLLDEERRHNPNASKVDELIMAIELCKKFLRNCLSDSNADSASNEQRRKEVFAKVVELNLEIEAIKDLKITDGKVQDPIYKLRGHEFVVQSSRGRNPYCEICLSTIWRLAQTWRRCVACGYRAHQKCIENVHRPCVSIRLGNLPPNDSPLNFSICPETTLTAQNYQCAECHAPIAFGESPEIEARLCDYTGKYYCRRCHWNDGMVIPARLVRNWDAERRPVCRASKQLLTVLQNKPIIDLYKNNSMLFKYINSLCKMKQLRTNILLMKSYFISCKNARKLRILQYLNSYQHFVETDSMYSLSDLIKLSNGKMLGEIETIVSVFRNHITVECEICRGNAFICELCDVKEEIYPFDYDVSICKTCYCVFHRTCFDRVSKRCSRCSRRRRRKSQMQITETMLTYDE